MYAYFYLLIVRMIVEVKPLKFTINNKNNTALYILSEHQDLI